MESFSFARARTLSTSSTSSSDSESLVTPITPRFAPSARAMALRAPCLKRNSSAPPTSPWRTAAALPEFSATLASGHATPTLAAVAVVAAAPMCSFAAPRSFSAAGPARSVRFNDSPPEAGVTHSGKHYDRRPIQCTKRDSENDLSLQRCATYGRDDEESSDASGPEADEEAAVTAQAEARWACLKNGAVIGGAVVRDDDVAASNDKPRVYPATTVAAANAGSTAAQATPAQPLHPNECSLPVHGVRSFGGLGARQGVESQYTVQPPSPRKSMSSLPHDDDNADDDADADTEGHATTRAAGSSDPLASFRSKSPNATPRQSPAVRIRWENVEGYFALSASETSDEDPAAAAEQVIEDLASVSPSTASTSTARADSPVRLTSVLMERRGSSSDGSACGSHRSAGSSSGMSSPRRRASNLKASPRSSPRQLSSPLPEDPSSSSTVVFSASPVLASPEAAPKADASAATSPLEDTGSVVLVPAVASASLSGTLASLGLPSPSSHLSAAGATSGSFMLDTSPMSSRCSSTDPWSGVSSDETDGEAGNHPDSPTGGWGSSSCTSPDLAPADVATRLALAQKKLAAVVEGGAQQPHAVHILNAHQHDAQQQQLSASPPSVDVPLFSSGSGSGADAVVPPSSMLPPALDSCNTMLGVSPSALRTRRAARAAAVAAEGRQAASLDNSPLLAPYSSCVTTDEEGAARRSVGGASSSVPGAAAAAGVKTRKKCGAKRRTARTSSSEGGGFYSSLDEGALGGF